MKQIFACMALAIASGANAQLNNGSFEVNGAFSLQGWEWTCADPVGMAEAPVGGGDWSAFKEAGQTKGCFPSYFYQRLTYVPYGIPVYLSGWVRCPATDQQFCLGATIGFGVLHNGIITVANSATSMTEEWTFLTVDHVFEASPGDTAVVLLSAGFIGGPIDPLPAGFDELTLEFGDGLGEAQRPIVSHYPDPVSDILYIGTAQGRMLSIDLLDAAGRTISTTTGGTGTRQVPVGALPPGSYFCRVSTDRGEQRFPFIKR